MEFYGEIYRKHPLTPDYEQNELKSLSANTAPAREVAQIALARTFFDSSTWKRFLDVGPSGGRSFHVMKMIQKDCAGFAIEADPRAASFLRRNGIQVIDDFDFSTGPSENIKGQFDLILMSHIVEHFGGNEVLQVLKCVRELLSPSGGLLLEVPFADYIRFTNHRICDVPHLSFFGEDSLRLICEKAGFSVQFLGGTAGDFLKWYEGAVKEADSELATFGEVGKGKTTLVSKVKRSKLYKQAAPMIHAAIGPFRKRGTYELLRDENFDYGANRTCLRAALKLNMN